MATLKRILDGWKRFGLWAGTQVARLTFTVLYFTLLPPFALGARLAGDRLRRKSEPAWLSKMNRDISLPESRRPF